MGKHIKSVIVSSWTDFLWGRHFNMTPAVSAQATSLDLTEAQMLLTDNDLYLTSSVVSIAHSLYNKLT